MESETCGVCGGDGRISNAFGGSSTSCPSCNGNGRRSNNTSLLRDVTKTKPSHHRPVDKAAATLKANSPSTHEGTVLAREVQLSSLSDAVKIRLVREIVEHEGSHGKCTQTFSKKLRKQLRSPA